MYDLGVPEATEALALAGPPPHSMAGMARWMLALGVALVLSDLLPADLFGCYVQRARRGLRGMALLRPDAALWRWVLLHETGHALMGVEVGYALADDGLYHSCHGDERRADACAAVLAIDKEDLRVALFEERRDLAECAALFGVPQRIVRLRCRQIGWPRPLNLAWAGICDWEPC